MTCNEVQRKIIAAEHSLPAAVCAHLDACVACRAFAEVHRRALNPLPAVAPRADLDRQVLDAARGQLAALRRSVPQKRGAGGEEPYGVGTGRRVLPFPSAWWAAAAALVVVGLVVACLFLAGSLGTNEPGVARTTAPVAVSAAPDWRALDLDTDMLALAVDLAMNGSTTVTVASGAEDTAAGARAAAGTGAARAGSIEDAILELELNLLLDEGLTTDMDQSDGV